MLPDATQCDIEASSMPGLCKLSPLATYLQQSHGRICTENKAQCSQAFVYAPRPTLRAKTQQ